MNDLQKLLPLLIGVFLLVGCGGTGDAISVEGTAHFDDGSKLPENTMLVLSSTTAGVCDAFAVVDGSGGFELQRASGGRGALPGSYTLSVRAPDRAPPSFYDQFDSSYVDGGAIAVTIDTSSRDLHFKIKRG